MAFWLTAALLTLCASAAVLWPFLRGAASALADPSAHDLEVYKDQIEEIERDVANGLVGRAEAEEARAEIGRRILRAAGPSGAGQTARSDRLGRAIATAAALSVPLLGWGTYAVIGSPDLPDQPLQARLDQNPAESSIDELVARAEQHLRENPDDGRGWDVLAPIYLRVGRAEDAVIAFRNSIRLNGASAGREAGIGEAMATVAGGMVTADAQAAFERALAMQPDDPRSRFYLALALAQEGKAAEAREMASALPADSPWRGAADQAIGRLDGGKTEGAQEEAVSGPTRDDMEAAAQMSAEDRQVMIEGMVGQLDARLRDNPADAQGWQRLVQSYQVLGRAGEARDALARGIEGLGPDTAAARELAGFAAGLGIAGASRQ